jgi:hypothetical protein
MANSPSPTPPKPANDDKTDAPAVPADRPEEKKADPPAKA